MANDKNLDNNTFERASLGMNFRIDNDSLAGAFDTSNFKQYNVENERLVSSAIAVKKERPFDEKAVRALFGGYTEFVPFDFQIENVLTMLNVFEGHGVFGDQVGLGKTIEAYMAMHAMHACDAIRNALIITTAKTADQWKREADRKFPGIFVTFVADGNENSELSFKNLIKKIKDDNDAEEAQTVFGGERKLRVYIITVDQLKANEESLDRAMDKYTWLEFIRDGLTDADYRARAYVPEDGAGTAEERRASRDKYLKKRFKDVYEGDCKFFGRDFDAELEKSWERENNAEIKKNKKNKEESGDKEAEAYGIEVVPDKFLVRNGFNEFVFLGTLEAFSKQTGYDPDNLPSGCIVRERENGVPTKRIICKYYLRDFNLCCPTVKQYVRLLRFFIMKLGDYQEPKINSECVTAVPKLNSEDCAKELTERLFRGATFAEAVGKITGKDVFKDGWLVDCLLGEEPGEDNKNYGKVLKAYAEVIDEIAECYRDLCNLVTAESEELEIYLSDLCGTSQDRLVDLLVIDEVHGFVDDADSDAEEKNDRNVKTLRNLAVKIAKKYCLLLSATPVRTQLSNVFDLAYISNMDRLGSNEASARAYFYRTVCGFDSDRPAFDFAEMVEGGNVNRLNAMINSQFTRRRVTDPDIREDMGEVSATKKGERTRNIIRFYFDVAKKLAKGRTEARAMAEQLEIGYGLLKRESRSTESASLFEWLKNFNESSIASNARLAELLVRVYYRGMIAYLQSDGAIFEESGLLSMRGINSLIDWNRPKTKHVEAYDPNGLRVGDIVRGVFKAHAGKLRGRTVVYGYSDCSQGGTDEVPEIVTALKGLGRSVKEDAFSRVTRNNADSVWNEVLVADGRSSAGLNLNDASALVLTSFDMVKNKTAYVAEPLDIEQWIGRIFRTGQKNDCHVVIVLRSQAEDWADNTALLRYYFDILGDTEGLDLFGEGNTEVSFVAPMLTSLLKKIVDSCKRGLRSGEGYSSEKLGLTVKFTGEIEGAGADTDFHSLVKFFFMNSSNIKIILDGREYAEGEAVQEGLKAVIKKVCAISKQ